MINLNLKSLKNCDLEKLLLVITFCIFWRLELNLSQIVVKSVEEIYFLSSTSGKLETNKSSSEVS